jgi:protein gp37
VSDRSAIEWTDATWNAVRGCTKVAAGCKHCYAERFAERFRGVPGHPFEQGFDVRLVPEALDLPLRWRKPRRVFVNSMSDLFHEDVPDSFILQVFEVMNRAPQHTFQVLTKRAARMREWWHRFPGLRFNVWAGVSVEDQRAADERIPELLATPAAVRFLSCEPLLGPVDLTRWMRPHLVDRTAGTLHWNDEPGIANRSGTWNVRPLDLVIVGGESGPGARPMHPAWARALCDQCVAARVPFFFKQWGEWRPFYRRADDPDARALPRVEAPRRRWLNLAGGHGFHGEDVVAVERSGKKAAGRELDGRTWNEMPEARHA